jgi:methyl-accepting chemotaxis protein
MDRGKTAVGVYGSINATIDRLIEVIGGIKTGSDEVHDAAELVSEGNESLSQRTQEQASSLEEVASSMEEMTSVINHNAENAKLSNQLTIEAREQAEKGVKVVGNAVAAVKEINESSNKIAEIISVIDEIAFQTNLLALNAAVEAARAGEQGRGFAVVASEVRNLAGRSASAAKEIKGLIQDSVDKVAKGAELVNASGESLEEIVTSVTKASVMVTEITDASKEQAEGIQQVNKALAEMDDITQQNATLVEEAAAASLFMGEQAQNLNDLVSYFNLGNQTVNQKKIADTWDENTLETKHEEQDVADTWGQNKLETKHEEQDVLSSQPVTNDQIEQRSVQQSKQGDADWKDF